VSERGSCARDTADKRKEGKQLTDVSPSELFDDVDVLVQLTKLLFGFLPLLATLVRIFNYDIRRTWTRPKRKSTIKCLFFIEFGPKKRSEERQFARFSRNRNACRGSRELKKNIQPSVAHLLTFH